jgi:hypothetical protein
VIRALALGAALVAATTATAACGGTTVRTAVPVAHPELTGDRQVQLVLYLDAALVHERWRVPLSGGRGSVEIPVDAGIEIDSMSVLGTEGARLVGLALRRPQARVGEQITAGDVSGALVVAEGNTVALVGDDRQLHVADSHGIVRYKGDAAKGVRAVVTLEGDGAEGWVEMTYATERISWSAAYSLIEEPGGSRATLEGAVAIDNKSGVEFPGAAITVVDKTAATARTKSAGDLAKVLLGTAKKDEDTGSRELGVVDVGRGQTRLALGTAPTTLPMRQVLVFDPVGPRFDAPGAIPQKDRNYGIDPKAPPPVVLRSYEIQLTSIARASFPAGPVRLFGRGDRGELTSLGAGRLFEHTQSVAKTATVPVGRAPDVKGKRERTDFFIDEVGDAGATAGTKGERKQRKIIEEFTITLTNAGAEPVEVLVREHLYRGATWLLAYHSAEPGRTAKEGDQQITLRVDVPGKGETRLVYRVVYNW